jgi:superfamily I DNA/RNA helicase/mRNA-degrading endonuclease RelE of RelBE toxin-antitoxin system
LPQKLNVAITSDFFTAFAKLPHQQQGKVASFIDKFKSNPTSPGINYEKIKDASDSAMRSVRIDQAYRGIVLKPQNDNVYLLLWVDHHDKAYEWARRHKCCVNSETGTLQIYDALFVPSPAVEQKVQSKKGLFDLLKDRELLRLGIPLELLPIVRGVEDDDALNKLEKILPLEGYEGLYYYSEGLSYENIVREREIPAPEDIDVSDFGAALLRATTRSRIMLIEDDVELEKILKAPLEQWRVFLHPSQRQLSHGTKSGAVRVLGGAGTGKTVVAMHRAKWLASDFAQHQRVLFTTFSSNLAQDIEANLRLICSNEEFNRIEVINLDRWVSRFLRDRDYSYSILYDESTTSYWAHALSLAPPDLDFSEAFYREEWQRVVQHQNIMTLGEYKQASRVGRGTRINREERHKIWPVFDDYRQQLLSNKKKEADDTYRDAAVLLQEIAGSLYDAVIVDEAQDMSNQAFVLLRALVKEGPNDMFIVGDGHQRIYGRNKVVLSHCGISIRGRARKLKLNYRTTEENRQSAVNLLEGFAIDDLDGGRDENKDYKSITHGEPPMVKLFDSIARQNTFVVEYLRKAKYTKMGDVCIVARTSAELTQVEKALADADIGSNRLTATNSSLVDHDLVKLATMHRVKGIEFEDVILVGINDGIVPLQHVIEGKGDTVSARQADLEERSLLYVAMTRAKQHVMVLGYGKLSRYFSVAG